MQPPAHRWASGGVFLLGALGDWLAAVAGLSDQGAGSMNTPLPRETLSDTLLRILVAIALKQPDPAERQAMIDILKKDGWL